MVYIFKTDVNHQQDADKIVIAISKIYPGFKVNFDLEDCDKILRIESEHLFDVDPIVSFVQRQNVKIEPLP